MITEKEKLLFMDLKQEAADCAKIEYFGKEIKELLECLRLNQSTVRKERWWQINSLLLASLEITEKWLEKLEDDPIEWPSGWKRKSISDP